MNFVNYFKRINESNITHGYEHQFTF